MQRPSRSILVFALLAFVVTLAGCAAAPRSAGGVPNDDPLEPLNRKVFFANRVLDGVILRPAAEVYRGVVPGFVQDRLYYAMRNLAEPRIFANNVLQWRLNAAGTTFSRFVLNSIAGIGGMFDIATREGLERQTGDFGQTLHGWGFGEGIYLVLPILGPSNVRDGIGSIADLYSTPPGPYLPHSSSDAVLGLRVADGVDTRARNIEGLDVVERGSLDFYSQLKSIVRQRRDAELSVVRPVRTRPGEELDDPAGGAQPPARSLSPRERNVLASASGPPDLSIAENSVRREASSLMVPLKYTSTILHSPPDDRIR